MEKIKILWADDEIELLKPHIIFLEQKGYHVVTSNNGDEALDILKEEPFDIVFLDENMPGLSGIETLSKIKVLQPNLPVVMITKSEEEIEFRKESVISYYDLSPDEVNYFVLSGSAQNSAYDHTHEGINILFKDGQLLDIAEVSDQLTAEVLSKTVKKYFICYPKAPFDTN
jgi:CheY-like chemotaxis protein